MSNLILQGQAWVELKEQATILVGSGLLPKAIDTPEKAIAIALKGRELGIPMMQAFSSIYIVGGKTELDGELMLAMILKSGQGKFEWIKTTDTVCTARITRTGCTPIEMSWTIEDAKRSMLMANPSWQKYPRMMLRWRLISEAARLIFPDIIQGSYTQGEIGGPVVVLPGYNPDDAEHREKLHDIFLDCGVEDHMVMKEISFALRGCPLEQLENSARGKIYGDKRRTISIEAAGKTQEDSREKGQGETPPPA